MLKFRNLHADEIECRVQSMDKYNGSWAILLLYKDARCDMNILDETVGVDGWQREHSRENANCTVSIWSDKLQQWVKKEDTGTESQSDAKKGMASDSFKRACFNLGIGRELYTKIPIFINPLPDELMEDKKNTFKDKDGNTHFNKKLKTSATFHVSKIETSEEKKITYLEISDKNNKVRFQWKA